jgi:DNA replication protein DnaC
MSKVTSSKAAEELQQLLMDLMLPAAAEQMVPRLTGAGLQEGVAVVLEVLQLDIQQRRERRVDRLRRASRLPPGKTLATLDTTRLPRTLVGQLKELSGGAFLEQATNVLCFGLPGVGKSHACCALGHALVDHGHSVLFTPAYKLVQELLAAKRALELPRALRKLDVFELLILDDIGYVQQSADEAEVLFTLMAERYERRSILITSNLVFSDWSRIFHNPMATAAAIDRLVHHSVILEFNVPSYRTGAAKNGKTPPRKTAEPQKEGAR